MKSLLVANRGEIAVRVIRTARELGLRTIAVYSELDRDALHVTLADEAWSIGGAPAADSYLNAERIISVARESQADAIHPGYGFLAENAEFAQAVMDAGIIWVGPPPSAIAVMGDKISSRRAAQKAGVATVPGTVDPLTSAEEIAVVAAEFGYPVAVKAAHGGGGKGLRVVHNEDELVDAYEGARREADAYFGNPEVYVEKYLVKPRHIEAQIIVDDHGHAMFLGERDCSVQRRHQKLIEEAPSTVLTAKQRKSLGEAAIAVAKACDYRNAGTIEFLLDQSGTFYFLEMNTRLQVEHTVTEMVTGIDLVAEQLAVASGEALSFTEVKLNGHAIELRINAENPAKNFLPNPGTITEYREPSGFGVRVDSWMQPGATVSQYYDNLIAKLVVWGRDRPEAIRRAKRAIDEYRIVGVATTIPAHRVVLNHPTFVAGEHHTRFMEDEVTLDGISFEPGQTLPADEALGRRDMTVEVGGRRFEVTYWTPQVAAATGKATPSRKPPKRTASAASASGDPGVITAPMQGTIVKVPVKAGGSVKADDTICILEAMKMENEVKSPIAGELVDLRVEPGDTVSPGTVIAIVK
jgi:acetyl-CoA/propionyl-CoA carboxylase biotin carboxyl carrier protein